MGGRCTDGHSLILSDQPFWAGAFGSPPRRYAARPTRRATSGERAQRRRFGGIGTSIQPSTSSSVSASSSSTRIPCRRSVKREAEASAHHASLPLKGHLCHPPVRAQGNFQMDLVAARRVVAVGDNVRRREPPPVTRMDIMVQDGFGIQGAHSTAPVYFLTAPAPEPNGLPLR